MQHMNLTIRPTPREQDSERQEKPTESSPSSFTTDRLPEVALKDNHESPVLVPGSFTPINADTPHSCSVPDYLAARLGRLNLTPTPPPMLPPDMQAPVYIPSLAAMPAVTFRYCEHMLTRKQNSFQICSS